MNRTELRKLYWLLAISWTALIYGTLGVVRPICEFLRGHIPFKAAISGLILLIFALALSIGFKHSLPRKKRTYFFLVVILAGYAGSFYFLPIPEERIHLVQYGVLAFLIYRALSLDLSGISAYICSFGLTSLLGWLDEMLQQVTPGRFFDWKDVLLNAISTLLALTFTYILTKEHPKP